MVVSGDTRSIWALPWWRRPREIQVTYLVCTVGIAVSFWSIRGDLTVPSGDQDDAGAFPGPLPWSSVGSGDGLVRRRAALGGGTARALRPAEGRRAAQGHRTARRDVPAADRSRAARPRRHGGRGRTLRRHAPRRGRPVRDCPRR